jgi:hypothetical protein
MQLTVPFVMAPIVLLLYMQVCRRFICCMISSIAASALAADWMAAVRRQAAYSGVPRW